jgi:hypothetical protein
MQFLIKETSNMEKKIHLIASYCILVSYLIMDKYVQFGKDRKGSDHGLFTSSEEYKVNQSKNYEIQNHENSNKKWKC